MAALESGGDSTGPMIGWPRARPVRDRPADVQRAREPGTGGGRARRRCAPQTPFPGDVLIVDDASPGRHRRARRRAGRAGTSGCTCCTARPSSGLGRAYVDGFRWALERDYSHILEMDADLSHPPERRAAPARGRGRRRPRARLALRRRRRRGRLAGAPAPDLAGRVALRAHAARRRASATSPAGSSASTGACSRPPTSTPCTARGTCSRSSSPTARCGWAAASSRCRSRSATARPARAR